MKEEVRRAIAYKAALKCLNKKSGSIYAYHEGRHTPNIRKL